MTIRRFKALLAAMIAGVALVGCNNGGFVEPDPSPEGTQVEEGEDTGPESATDEGGADAEAPPP